MIAPRVPPAGDAVMVRTGPRTRPRPVLKAARPDERASG